MKLPLQQNVGELDRLLRSIGGVYLMLVGFLFVQGIVGNMVGAMGALVLLTAFTGYCGIYTLLHINTLEATKAEAAQESKE